LQDKTKISILIDHPYYGHGRMKTQDLTFKISSVIWNWARDKPHVIVKRFCKGGIERVTENNYLNIENYEQNAGLSYSEACKIYNTTDIFFVTHVECMGLVVLETAMSGALIVSPEGYIKKELLRNVHHHKLPKEFNNFDMNEIIEKIDHQKSVRKVKSFTWENGTNIIADTFLNWDNYKKTVVWSNNHKGLKIL
jgi:hypothetical protein